MEAVGIGRIVHYVAYGTPNLEFPPGAHRAAIITEIERTDDGNIFIGLCVLNPTGMYFIQHVKYHGNDDGSDVQPGTWHWPERV